MQSGSDGVENIPKEFSDLHVPVKRLYETTNILTEMNADVTEKIYDNMGHTINEDEIGQANKLVFKL